MSAYLLRRLGIALAVAFTVSLISFFLLHLSGDLATAIAGPEATAEQIEVVRHQHGLDKPLPTQYVEWVGPLSSIVPAARSRSGRPSARPVSD